MDGDVAPSPVFAGGLVLVTNPSNKLSALRPDGQGDVTESKTAWFSEEAIPDVTSPVATAELAFTVTTDGFLVCFDMKDGKKVWEHELHLEVQASPAIVGNRLYVFATDGKAVVAEVARAFKELGRGELDDKILASPAFAAGRIYVRGAKNLYCLGAAAAK